MEIRESIRDAVHGRIAILERTAEQTYYDYKAQAWQWNYRGAHLQAVVPDAPAFLSLTEGITSVTVAVYGCEDIPAVYNWLMQVAANLDDMGIAPSADFGANMVVRWTHEDTWYEIRVYAQSPTCKAVTVHECVERTVYKCKEM